jgi:Enoyl-(Acyl carrier protein) reductase
MGLLAERGATVFGIAGDADRLAEVFADGDGRGVGLRSRGEPQRTVLPLPRSTSASARDGRQHRQCRLDRRRRGRGVLGGVLRGQTRADRPDRALAVEFTKEKLRVNAVCPGGMPTAQATEFTAPDGADWDLIMRIASPRGFMETRDVAKAIAFLASDDAAAVHGAVYRVDNGKGAG